MNKKDSLLSFLNTLVSIDDLYHRQIFNETFAYLSPYITEYLGLMIITDKSNTDYGVLRLQNTFTVAAFKTLYFNSLIITCKKKDDFPDISTAKKPPYAYVSEGDPKVYMAIDGEYKVAYETVDDCCNARMRTFVQSSIFKYTTHGFVREPTRNFELMIYEKDHISVIPRELKNWYIFNEMVSKIEFVNFLERHNYLNVVYKHFFISIEKEKQIDRSHNDESSIKEKLAIIKNTFETKFADRALSDTISPFISAWFYNGNNSPIFLSTITDRMRVVPEMMKRFKPSSFGKPEDYLSYTGEKYDNRTCTFVVKGANITKDIVYNGSYDNSSTALDAKLSYNKFIYYGNDNINKDALGGTDGDSAYYYAYVKDSPYDSATSKAYEYFLSNSDSSIKTFCFNRLSSSNELYMTFFDFISSSYYNSSVLSGFNNLTYSQYAEKIYEAIKKM